MRLQKFIANSGYTSRRKAERLIKEGKVFVNGKKITTLGTKVTGNDEININGEILTKEEKVYYLLNKPRGVITSTSDDKGRKTVIDLIDTDKRIYPIGRLDYNTTGILILTNDGELTNKLSHPSNNIEKKYLAKLNKDFTIEDFHSLKKGIKIDNRTVIPKRLKLRKKNFIEITIVEGRNHIVKNIFEKMGYMVDKLTRVEYDFLNLGSLKSGDYRPLTIKEVKKLYKE